MLPEFSQARILIVGDLMLDRYWHGAASRISPEAPVPVVEIDREDVRLGGAGNVAVNAAALGAKVCLLALAGDDDMAGVAERMLSELGIACWVQRVAGSRTVTKLRIMSRHQQLIRLDFEDHFPGGNMTSLLAAFRNRLATTDIVVLSDYAKGALGDCQSLILAAKKAGIMVVVDPKGNDFSRYRGATLITPNFSEFEAVVGTCEDEGAIERRGITLRDSLDIGTLLITRSEKGMTLLARGREPVHFPARSKEVFDVTGAGDTVVATLASTLAIGMSVDDAVGLSNVAASIVITKMGTASVTPSELEYATRDRHEVGDGGVFDEDRLFEKIAVAKRVGERVIMTNGCFDILHPGHVDYLEKARALGDRLVVAVNDDESVHRLKGVGRPINPLTTRMRMLSALACVDWVVPFAEDSPERLICRLLPDVLVKGGDYSVEQIEGGKCVRAAGGQVRVLQFVAGYSTTDLIQRIKINQDKS